MEIWKLSKSVNSVGRKLLPLLEAPYGLPDWLGLPVPVSCLRSPTGQHGPKGLLLQLDGIRLFQCPPRGSEIAALTGTSDLLATAPSIHVDNGGQEHGPFRLNVPSLPRNLGAAVL